MHDLDALLNLAVEIANSAGDILLEGRRNGFGKVTSKSTSVDIVTEIDHASEKHIVSQIRTHRPDDGMLGEEGTSFEGTSGVHWLVDPLDGTVNYTYGLNEFAVSIGVEIEGVPSVGVVFCPAVDELFTAVTGRGAYLNDEPIAGSTETTIRQSLVATGFSYDSERRANEAEVLTHLLPAARDIRRGGSAAIDLCRAACGRVDAYYEHWVRPWDVAGGQVIASEAGLLVTAINGRDPAGTSVLAANPTLHGRLAELLNARRSTTTHA